VKGNVPIPVGQEYVQIMPLKRWYVDSSRLQLRRSANANCHYKSNVVKLLL